MPYQAVIEARKAAEEKSDDVRAAVRLGLQMKREADERKAAQEEERKAARADSLNKETSMGKPNKEIIELCEELLERAKSGKLEGLAVAEIHEGERISANFRSMSQDNAMKAVAFLGHLSVKAFMNLEDEREEGY